MKNYKIALLSLVIGLAGCKSIQQQNLPTDLTFDPQVMTGELDNGFKYYIADNQTPEDRVYIRFVVNAGSMNEDDDQRGVAHIVEHMAFNGTKNYPGNQVISELEKAGMKFGADINAFTDFENTVYTLNLPSNDEKTIDLALDIVTDWAGNVTMLKGDLDAERGIVLEEWRARLGPMLRLGDKKSAIEMAGSRYVERDPIGDPKTIKTVSKYRVADFYHRWYRPDNMSIVVVGDIDEQVILNKVQQRLSAQAKPQRELENVDYSIPLKKHWRTASVSEPGISTPSVELSFFSDFEPENTVARYRQDLVSQIATRLLNVRLQRWEQNDDHSISSANFYSSNLGRETSQSVFSLQLSQPDYQDATQQLFDFIAQAQQHGFSDAEVKGEIKRLQRLVESSKDDKQYSIDLAGDLMMSAASGQLLINPEDQYRLNQQLLSLITSEEVNQQFKAIFEPQSRLLLTTHPTSEEQQALPVNHVESWWNNSMAKPQPQWSVDENSAQLPILDLTSGTVKKEKQWAKYRLTEYRLSNGSKLIYRYSDSNPGQVHFKALTKGGLRSIPAEDYHKLRMATYLVDETGVGELPLQDLQTIFRGNPVVMSTLMGNYQQGFSGWAKTDSLSKMFTLFHLKLGQNLVSEKALNQYRVEERQVGLDAEDEFVRDVSELRYPGIETVYSENSDVVETISAKELSDVYQHYVADKTDFTYFIVGDIAPRELETLAEKYLASVPVRQQLRESTMIKAHSPQQRFAAKTSLEPRAEVELYLTMDSQWRPDNAYYLEMGGELVQEQLRLKLREQASGIYSVSSWFWQDADSVQAEGRIQFSCAPERVDELLALTHQVLDQVSKQGVDGEALVNKRIQRQDQMDRYIRSDLGMLDALEKSYMLVDSPDLVRSGIVANEKATKASVDAVILPFLRNAEAFEAVLMPKQ